MSYNYEGSYFDIAIHFCTEYGRFYGFTILMVICGIGVLIVNYLALNQKRITVSNGTRSKTDNQKTDMLARIIVGLLIVDLSYQTLLEHPCVEKRPVNLITIEPLILTRI
uniref:Uncharacterized protein n=1 Tax=Rhizophagus irregularis (strain DAOM 181602 / DAOM 197198 / MUCL 43194) TaxID=747089 RepID=U9U5R1_RHIID